MHATAFSVILLEEYRPEALAGPDVLESNPAFDGLRWWEPGMLSGHVQDLLREDCLFQVLRLCCEGVCEDGSAGQQTDTALALAG
eukprot:scaffold4233_cov153-Pinguiococcus_pyrenoidosus.AAC.5